MCKFRKKDIKKFIMQKENNHTSGTAYLEKGSFGGEQEKKSTSAHIGSLKNQRIFPKSNIEHKVRRADIPIFTNEYWRAMQYREAGYIHFFLITPMNLICRFGSSIELYFSRAILLLLYLNVWILLLGSVNTFNYYYWSHQLRKEYGRKKTKSLFSPALILLHISILALSIMNVASMVSLTGASEIRIYNEKGPWKIEKSSLGILPWVTYSAHSYAGIFLVYLLMGLSTVALSYTEIKYRFVTENKKLSLDQIKYIIIKIATIIVCTTLPIIHSTLNFIWKCKIFIVKKVLYSAAYVLASSLVYGIIGILLIGSVYGSFAPWKDHKQEAAEQKSLKKKSKIFLFTGIAIYEMITVYYIVKEW